MGQEAVQCVATGASYFIAQPESPLVEGTFQVSHDRVQERASVAVGLSKVFTGDSNSRWYGTRAV